MIEIPLANGRGFAVVDDADAELVSRYRWRLHRHRHTAYARTDLEREPSRRSVYLHVLLMGQTGIDHQDGDGLNCQRSNLRPATQSQNLANMRLQAGSSRYKGVRWHRLRGKWAAEIQVDQRKRHIGLFISEEDAARAYDRAAREVWGEFARVNL